MILNLRKKKKSFFWKTGGRMDAGRNKETATNGGMSIEKCDVKFDIDISSC